MATAKTISQRIALEGAEEIRRILEQIGQVGEKAMAQIGAATAQATKNLEIVSGAVAKVEQAVAKVADSGRRFGTALGDVGKAAGDLGSAVGNTVTRIGLLAGAATGAGLAIFGLAKSSANAADEIIKNAQATGLAVDRYQALRFAAAQAGVDTEQFGRGITAFSKQVTEAAQKEAQALIGFVDTVRKQVGQPGVFNVQPGRDLGAEFRIIGEAAAKLQADLKALGIEVPLFKVRQELQALANGGADARKKFEDLTGAALPSLNSGLDQLRKLAHGAGDPLKALGVRATEVIDGVRRVRGTEDVLLDVAEAFSKLADGPQKVAISTELLSKLGPKWAAFLNSGRDGINELTKDFKESGLTLTKEQTRIGEAMNDAISRMGTFASAAKTQIGLLFAPTITKAADAFSALIIKNSGAIIGFAESLRDQAIPYVEAFFNLLRGIDDGSDAAGQLIKLRDAAIAFGEAVKGAVLNIILPAFGILLAGLQLVADGINKVFGTTLTGGQVGIAVVVAKLIGAFGLLGAALGLVVASIKLLWAGLALIAANFGLVLTAVRSVLVVFAAFIGWPALLVASLIAAGVAIVTYWDEIKAGAQATWDFIKKLFNTDDPVGSLWAWLSKGLAKEWEAVKKLLADEWEKLKRDVERTVAEILKLFDIRPDDTLWSWLTRALTRELDAIKKDIQATIDWVQGLIDKFKLLPKVPEGSSTIPSDQPGGIPTVPLLGQPGRDRRFDQLPQSPNIEDRRGEVSGQLGQIEQEAAAIIERVRALAAQAGEAIATVFDGLRDKATTVLQDVTSAVAGGGDLIGTLLQGAFERAAGGIQTVIDGVVASINAMLESLSGAIDAVGQRIDATIAQVIARLESAVAKAQELARAAAEAVAAAASAGGGNGGGFAAGGFTGHGGKFDPAGIVHRGEHVQPANVVARPGMLSFLEALRRSGGDLRGVLGRLSRGFATGGLVFDRARFAGIAVPTLPGFAAGGLVPAPGAVGALPFLGTVSLDLGGGNIVHVGVDRNAVDQFYRAGLHRHLVRAGKVVR